jgi:RHS repeat-associated protein
VLITQSTTTTTYGGPNGFKYGNPSQIATTVIDEDTTSHWHGDSYTDTVTISPYESVGSGATGWCIHLPQSTSETRSFPTGSPTTLTHSTSFAVNQNNYCEVDVQTVEPSTPADEVATTYTYDACGNVSQTSVQGYTFSGSAMTPRLTKFQADAQCLRTQVITNVVTGTLSLQTTLGYDYRFGSLSSVKDANSLTTNWTYSDIGQKTLEQRPDGTETSWSYTACTPSTCGTPLAYYITRSELDATSGHNSYWNTQRWFDAFGRMLYDEPIQSNGVRVGNYRAFDNLGRQVLQTNPYGNGYGTYYTTIIYDLVNRPTQRSRPISSSNSNLEYTNYTYQGRTTTVQDPKGYTTTRNSDVLGELLRVIDPDLSSTTYYAYDPFGHLTSIIDPAGNPTTRTYDTLGYLLTGTSDYDRGTWTYQYDSLGELTNLRDAKTSAPSWTQQLTYDWLSRPLTRIEAEGTTTWTWDTATNGFGKLAQLSGLGGTEAYTYDAYSRPATHTQTWSSNSYQIGYTYNTIGKLNTLTYPATPLSANPFQVLYGYTNGYLSSVQNYTGGTLTGVPFWELTPGGVNMDPWGHVVDETLGTTAAVRIQSAFDAVTGWINTREVGSGGTGNNLANLAYQWDLNGNLSQRQDVIQGLTEAFNYDNLNRLQTSTLNGTQNLSVAIDNTGNITSQTAYGVTVPYTYDPVHKHGVSTVGTGSTERTYSYDANGNVSAETNSGTAYSATWTSANQLSGMQLVSPQTQLTTFQYGPDRQRKQQTALYAGDGDGGPEVTTYVAGLFEIETTPAQTHYKHFVQVPGGTQIIYDLQSVSGAQVTYVTSDHLGSGNLLLSSAGTKLINESYAAFGYRRSSNWSAPLASSSGDYTTIASTTRRGYTDAFHEMLDNVGLIHMNGRIYDPVIGRFLSADPINAEVGNSQSGNPYSYVQNRPLTLTDPTGLQSSWPNVSYPNCQSFCRSQDNADLNETKTELGSLAFQETGLGDYADWGGMPPINSFTGIGWFEFTHMGGFSGPNGAITPQTVAAANAANQLALATSSGVAPKLTVIVEGAGSNDTYTESPTIAAWMAALASAQAVADQMDKGFSLGEAGLTALGTVKLPAIAIPGLVAPTARATAGAINAESQLFINAAETVGAASLIAQGASLAVDAVNRDVSNIQYSLYDYAINRLLFGAAVPTDGLSLVPAALFNISGGTKTLLSQPGPPPGPYNFYPYSY